MTAEASQAGSSEDLAADGERPLRIALLTYKGNPFCGGQGVYTRHLSRELARLGHRVEVIGSQPYPVLDGGVPLTELPSLDLYRSPDPFRTPKRDEYRDWIDALEVATMWTGGFPEPLTFSLRARRHLRARTGEFDVVHDNQTLGYGLLGDIGAPLVTTIHHPITVDRQLELDAAEGWQQRMSKRRWYAFTRMQKRVARRLPSVLTVSGTSRQEIVDHLGVRDDRIHVVHIGADTSLFRPDPSVPVVPGRIVTTSSADVPLKGLVFLVEALAKVRTEHPGAHLVVVGKRPAEGPVAAAVERYGLEGAVDFVKGISDAELVDLVRSAEVACVPSLYEGFSLPAAEAMATGTPLVATTGGAIPEVAGRDGETCLAVPPGDPGALAVALSRLLGDPDLRARLGAAGRERVLARFTWARAAEGTVTRYREAIAAGAGRTAVRPTVRTRARSAAAAADSAPPATASPAAATPAAASAPEAPAVPVSREAEAAAVEGGEPAATAVPEPSAVAVPGPAAARAGAGSAGPGNPAASPSDTGVYPESRATC
ncbi:glycosyltransferase family 4 protein [Streptomyces sp. 351MFTsu5.1]|uniref:glycosyltransferase family 4 protein n=1 Tax=Streptomyces sp. 351MFTsu5.1 TaxID=1172180 RepID=UPI00037FC2BE|nr:glycosyltransferase family 4 protein [Streptomyces sp. 351MFTsu5.1]